MKWDKRASQGFTSKKQDVSKELGQESGKRRNTMRGDPMKQQGRPRIPKLFSEDETCCLKHPNGQSGRRKNRLEAIVWSAGSRTSKREQLSVDAHHMSIPSYCHLEIHSGIQNENAQIQQQMYLPGLPTALWCLSFYVFSCLNLEETPPLLGLSYVARERTQNSGLCREGDP